MARSIWKLGKFNKGINSFTDPKDISSSEWVELDDVNVSKVGVAKPLGSPTTDSSIHPTTTGSLIGGKGLYRFSSDNSFLPSLPDGNSHALEHTVIGGGGSLSVAEYSIDSVVWLFDAKPSDSHTTTIKFQLLVGGTAIMDPLTVISGNLPQNTSDSTSTTTNIFASTSYATAETAVYDFGDTPIAATHTNIPHQLCKGATTSDTFISVEGDVSDTNSSFFWNQLDSDNSDLLNLNNLNLPTIPFSASYSNVNPGDSGNSGDYPSGNFSFHDYYMLGFYKWDGYNTDVLADGGMANDPVLGSFFYTQAPDISHPYLHYSRFCAPRDSNFDNSHWPAGLLTYAKAQASFHKHVIDAINAYSPGEGSNVDYNAEFDVSGESTMDEEFDRIKIKSVNKLTPPGDGSITAHITCDAAGGSANFVGGVNLLTSKERNGTGYGYNNGSSTIDDTVNEWSGYASLSDAEVPDADGGSMVLSGDTVVQGGAPEDAYDTWKLTFRGNPNSGNKINIKLFGNGTIDVSVVAEYDTNFIYASAVKTAIFNGTAVLGNSDTGTAYYADGPYLDTNYSNDVVDAYYIDIKTGILGNAGLFNMQVYWEDSELNVASSIGQDDEQLALISNSESVIDLSDGNVLKPIDFKLWSEATTSWISLFNNNSNTFSNYNDVRALNNTTKYLNWYSTNVNNSDPVYFDEGNVLRIAESNFKLLQELDSIFEDTNTYDNINNNQNGYMWANPIQWIGYKDLSNHYNGQYNLNPNLTRTKGFFIGKQAKIWSYSVPPGSIGGLNTSNSSVVSTEFNEEYMRMKIYKQDSASGIDWVGTIKLYAVACYDDGSESLPGHKFDTDLTFGDTSGAEDGDTLRIQMQFKPTDTNGKRLFDDERINGVRLYYTDSEENHSTFWNLGKFDFNLGFIKALTVNTLDDTTGNEDGYPWIAYGNSSLSVTGESGNEIASSDYIEYLEMPKTEAYEDINGHSPFVDTISVEYKAVCIAARRTFVGNLRIWNGSSYEYYNDRMIVSPINSLDVYPYSSNLSISNVLELEISDGDKIVALASFGDKILQYKEKICYILNISTGIASEFFIEERLKWKGIINKNHYCTTDKGIFWVNNRGAWIYDGTELEDLFIQDNEDDSQQRIDSKEWESFITNNTVVGYNAPSREIIILKNHTYSSADDSDCYVYSLIVNAWTKGKKKFFTASNKSVSNFQSIGKNGKLMYLSEERQGSSNDDAEIR